MAYFRNLESNTTHGLYLRLNVCSYCLQIDIIQYQYQYQLKRFDVQFNQQRKVQIDVFFITKSFEFWQMFFVASLSQHCAAGQHSGPVHLPPHQPYTWTVEALHWSSLWDRRDKGDYEYWPWMQKFCPQSCLWALKELFNGWTLNTFSVPTNPRQHCCGTYPATELHSVLLCS